MGANVEGYFPQEDFARLSEAWSSANQLPNQGYASFVWTPPEHSGREGSLEGILSLVHQESDVDVNKSRLEIVFRLSQHLVVNDNAVEVRHHVVDLFDHLPTAYPTTAPAPAPTPTAVTNSATSAATKIGKQLYSWTQGLHAVENMTVGCCAFGL